MPAARKIKKTAKATDNRSRLQVDRSKTIAPTGRGKPISGGKAVWNVYKTITEGLTPKLQPSTVDVYKKAGKNIGKKIGQAAKQQVGYVKAGAKALRPYTIFAKTKRAKSRVKK